MSPAARPTRLALRTVHLRGVGPDKARFDPLTLDLTVDGRAADRALVHLVNTGGKTTLIRLVSSLVVPAARDQVGKANLGEYIATGDVAHIVCVWDTDTGPLVTGVVAEWPNRQRPAQASMADLQRRWYAYRADGLDVTDLPYDSVDDTGRRHRRTTADFAARMDELFRDRPKAQFTWARNQSDWARVLDDMTPLDPELFRYQMRMNDEETGAKALVAQFSTTASVIAFFIAALNDTDTLNGFAETLATYAHAAARRGEHTVELQFCEQIQAALELYAQTHADEQRAVAANDTATSRAAELAGALDQRLRDDDASAAALEQSHMALSKERRDLETEINTRDERRQQLALESARLEQATAADAHTAAIAAESAADADLSAWQAVPLITAHLSALAREQAATAAYERVEGQLSPLRRDTEAAAAGYAAKLRDLAAEAAAAQAAAIEAASTAEQDRRAAEADIAVANQALTDIAAKTAAAQAVIEQADQQLADLRADEIAGPDETAADAADRHKSDADVARADEESLRRHLDANAEARAAADTAADSARSAEAEAVASAQSASSLADRFHQESAELGLDEIIGVLADAPCASDLVPGPAEATTLAEAANTAATAADDAARRAQTALDAINPEIEALRSHDTARPADEVSAVAETLTNAGIGAVPAVRWLVANLPDTNQRQTLVSARPELSTAVIVMDHARLDAAQDTLASAGLAGKLAILVCSPAHVTDENPTPRDGFVLPPHRGLLDPDGARALLAELEAEAERHQESARAQTTHAALMRNASARLAGFARAWEGTDAAALDEAAQDAADQAHTAKQVTLAAMQSVADLANERTTLTERLGLAQSRASRCDESSRRCRDAAAAREAAEAAARTVAELVEARKAAGERISDATTAQDAATAAWKRHMAAAGDADTQARTYRSQGAAVPVPAAPTAPDGSLTECHATWTTLQARLDAQESGRTDTAARDNAVRELAGAQQAVDRLDPDVRVAATARSGELGSADADTLAATIAAARGRQADCQRVTARAETRLEQATAAVAERTPRDRPNHATLPADWDITSAEAIAELSVQVYAEALDLQAKRTAADTQLAALDRQRTSAVSARTQLSAARNMWPEDPIEGQPAYAEAAEKAQRDMGDLLRAREAARTVAEAAAVKNAEAWALVKETASDAAWSDLSSAIRDRCRVSTADEVARHATGWVHDLAIRIKSLRDDLEALDVHRGQLVVRLVDLCDTQRRLLHDITRQSVLPDGLGGLSGQSAFKIGFETRDPVEARGLLSDRVDQWARELAEGSGKVSAADRIRWLTQAVTDTVRDRPQAGAFKVEVLKPNIDGQVQYRTPDRVATEYSGGQELTLAVMLYCTLAAVRAAHRTSGARPAGTLLLDNPFGAASNATLIRLQQALAARAGVQLICATGIEDPGVLHAFDGEGGVVVSLRNDRDQRRGVKYLRIADDHLAAKAAAALTGGRPIESQQGFIDAARYNVAGIPTDD